MKIRIVSTNWWPEEADDLLKDYPCLNDFAFEVKEEPYEKFKGWIRDENGNPIADVEPRIRTIPYVNIDTLEGLLKLMDTVEHPMIINRLDDTGEIEIEIYDGWRE